MPKIALKFKDSVLADYHLPTGFSIKIGRQKDNDIVVENLAVSNHHGKIDSAGDGFLYIDLKSKNGTLINDEFVSSHWLEHGDVISIGKHSLIFTYFDSESRPDNKPQSEIDKTMVMDTNEYRTMAKKKDSEPADAVQPEPAPRQDNDGKNRSVRGYITYLVGGEGTMPLKHKVTKIGKGSFCDIVVKGWKIGKTAATISRTRDGYFFSYVSGWAKPKINDKKVSKKPQKLDDSDIIVIGGVQLQFIGKKRKNKQPADP